MYVILYKMATVHVTVTALLLKIISRCCTNRMKNLLLGIQRTIIIQALHISKGSKTPP